MPVPKSYPYFKRENISDLGLEIKLRVFLIDIPKVAPSEYLKMTMIAHHLVAQK